MEFGVFLQYVHTGAAGASHGASPAAGHGYPGLSQAVLGTYRVNCVEVNTFVWQVKSVYAVKEATAQQLTFVYNSFTDIFQLVCPPRAR